MKNVWKILALTIACCLCMVSLVSCADGVTTEEVKTLNNEFLAAITAEDYEKAKSLLHPSLNADLESVIQEIEDAFDIDFQQGVTVEKYTETRITFFSTSIMGSQCQLTMDAKVGDVPVQIQVAVVRNNDGFGIYSFYVNK